MHDQRHTRREAGSQSFGPGDRWPGCRLWIAATSQRPSVVLASCPHGPAGRSRPHAKHSCRRSSRSRAHRPHATDLDPALSRHARSRRHPHAPDRAPASRDPPHVRARGRQRADPLSRPHDGLGRDEARPPRRELSCRQPRHDRPRRHQGARPVSRERQGQVPPGGCHARRGHGREAHRSGTGRLRDGCRARGHGDLRRCGSSAGADAKPDAGCHASADASSDAGTHGRSDAGTHGSLRRRLERPTRRPRRPRPPCPPRRRRQCRPPRPPPSRPQPPYPSPRRQQVRPRPAARSSSTGQRSWRSR